MKLRMRDMVGLCARLNCDVVAKNGTSIVAGELVKLASTWRGGFHVVTFDKRDISQVPRAWLELVDELHPVGRCTCGGGGECTWCVDAVVRGG